MAGLTTDQAAEAPHGRPAQCIDQPMLFVKTLRLARCIPFPTIGNGFDCGKDDDGGGFF